MQIKNDEHVFICGMTGSGKTHLVKKLYSEFPPGHVAAIDLKGELNLPNAVILHGTSRINSILDSGKNVILRIESAEEIEEGARLCFSRGKVMLWLDEGADIIPLRKIGPWMKRIFMRGRTRKVVCWTLTQRPAWIDKAAISQAMHHFIFSLIFSEDKKTICENIPLTVEDLDKLKKYWFFHYQQGDQKAKLFSPI